MKGELPVGGVIVRGEERSSMRMRTGGKVRKMSFVHAELEDNQRSMPGARGMAFPDAERFVTRSLGRCLRARITNTGIERAAFLARCDKEGRYIQSVENQIDSRTT